MSALVGREVDVARVSDALANARLVTVTGPLGVGKSAVASEVARAAGFVRIDAASAADAAALAEAIARAISEANETEPALFIDDVIDAAAAHEALESAQRTGAALPRLPRLLVTSRGPLLLPGELRVDVEPLDTEQGVLLLRSLAHFAAPPSDEVLARIVVQLDALPLAIVLAAGRSGVLSAEELSLRLGEPLRVLRGGSPPRHASLELVVASACAPLAGDERRALACAALFEGMFSADGFEAVCEDALDGDPLDALQGLLDKSLLLRASTEGSARFRLLHGVRVFARSAAFVADESWLDHSIRRHEAFVASAARDLAASTYGPRAEAALAEIERMLPDILAAFANALTARPARAAALWLSLFDAILFREVLPLDDLRFGFAIDAADQTGDLLLRVRTRVLRARARLDLGPPESAQSDLDQALALAQKSDDPALAAEVRRSLGWLALARAQPEPALRELEAALAASVAARDVRGHADALAATGLAEHLLGETERARDSLRLARALHAEGRDVRRGKRVDEMLALIDPSLARGRPGAAADELREAIARHEARGMGMRLAVDLALLASLEEKSGGSEAPAGLRLRARAAARASGLADLEAWVTAKGGDVASPEPSRAGWVVGPEARTLIAPDGTRHDLARHGSLRRVLDELVDARLAHPGSALSAEAVLAAGWPGERVLHEAGLLRVYSTIRRLRRMGLEGSLVTRDEGYLLDPELPIRRG